MLGLTDHAAIFVTNDADATFSVIHNCQHEGLTRKSASGMLRHNERMHNYYAYVLFALLAIVPSEPCRKASR